MDTLAQFNEDMRILALNTFQMQEMMDHVLEENDTIVSWLSQLEIETNQAEEDLVKMGDNVDKARRFLSLGQ